MNPTPARPLGAARPNRQRRTAQVLLGLLVGLSCAICAPARAQPLAADEFRVTLLGTGSPAPAMNRFGPGVLVQAGGKNLLAVVDHLARELASDEVSR